MRKQLRSRVGIVRDVLKTINEEGKTPITRIMYGSRLPYDRLITMLDYLVKKGLVKKIEDNEKKYYILTEKGMKLLDEIERLQKILDKFGLEI
ncbi:MAG: winged helix-turn-helix domain-containing protein [Thermoprotei archaeon]